MAVVGELRGLWVRFYLGELISSAWPAYMGGGSYLLSRFSLSKVLSDREYTIDV
ncbi:hypothetical protein N431DRAFT_430563 [Stipitochalara longipes BDJ]|nr:hypothetical protein N431DRAFT_430563 [Stipitochalara longipes BDJ]